MITDEFSIEVNGRQWNPLVWMVKKYPTSEAKGKEVNVIVFKYS